jgi:hypothetical protein
MIFHSSSFFTASLLVLGGVATTACECDDCHRAGPIVGYVRILVQDEQGAPLAGASIHIDNRSYITEPGTTGNDGSTVLLVYLDTAPADTGTITVFPPAAYEPPAPRPVTVPSSDTVVVSFVLGLR